MKEVKKQLINHRQQATKQSANHASARRVFPLYSIKMRVISALLTNFLLIGFFLALATAPKLKPALAFTPVTTDTKQITVSASITDNAPPTTPILISPENNSFVTTGYVTFVWQGSTDNNGIKSYELSLNGSRYIVDIPSHDHETVNYTLDYEATTHYFTLKVKNLIPDGAHTWKIRANDVLNNGTNSATWSFTVDSQGPSFVLTQVGELTTSISAQDISTIPTTPLELSENQPQLLAHGETNSTVVLTVTIPDDPTQTWTQTTDSNGNWGQQLGLLPRDSVIVLDFTITDQAGLVSILSGVELIIKSKVITYPPASPPPAPTPAPSPGVAPSPGFTPAPAPTPTPAHLPLISIKLIPPIEIAHEIIQEGFERLPAPLKAIVATVPPGVRSYLSATAVSLAPIAGLILILLLLLLALIAMLGRFGRNLSPQLIWRTLQALHLWPTGQPQGLVYDSQSHQGIPFALIEVRDENQTLVDLAVSDRQGIYRGLALRPGNYQLTLPHPGYRFPTNQLRPNYLQPAEFYRGEVFAINDQSPTPARHQRLQLIPLDQLEPAEVSQARGARVLSSLSLILSTLFLPLFVLTGILALIFPTTWNWLGFLICSLEVGWQAKAWFKAPELTGVTIDDNGQPLANSIVMVTEVNQHRFAALTQTNQRGEFNALVRASTNAKQSIAVRIIKPGLVWMENGVAISSYPLSKDNAKQHLVASLTPLAKN